MINPVAHTLKLYTLYDGSQMVLVSVGLLALLAGYSYYKVQSRELLYTHIAGWISIHLLFTIFVLLINQFTQIEGTTLNQVLYIASLLVAMINLAGLTDAYVAELSVKKFDFDHITRRHFDQTIKQTLLLVLLIAGSIPLLAKATIWTLILFGTTSIFAIAINHLVARKILVDRK